MCVSVPSAFTVCASTLYLFSSESIVVVVLLGAGPGSCFDFAGSIFHVPLLGSSAAFAVMPIANTPTKSPKIKMVSDLCRMVVPPQAGNCRYLTPQSPPMSTFFSCNLATDQH